MKIIYMGTPDFAVPALKALANSEHKVCAVFTQPDKPRGRKMIMTPPDVKVCAEKLNIPVYQPETFKDGKPLEIINKYNPDVIVVAAYGKILPKSVLDSAKYGCINLHGSLLPKYRGASPIQQSVLNGDKETGVTAMQMDVGLDTGDILKVVKTEIGVNETSGELFDRLSLMGGELLKRAKSLRLSRTKALQRTLQKLTSHFVRLILQNRPLRCIIKSEDLIRGRLPQPKLTVKR